MSDITKYGETCANCGGDYAIHHYQTSQCPVGGREAPAGRKQEWKNTTFEKIAEPQPTFQSKLIRINAERIAQLEAKLQNAERDAWNAAIAAAAARLKEEAARDVWTFQEFTILSNSANKLLQLTK